MILCVGTTPAAQRVMIFRQLTLDAVNRAVTTLDGVAGKSVNVAKVLHTLGEQTIAAGFLGGNRGKRIDEELTGRRIELDFVTVAAQTRECVTVIDERAGTVTELVEESSRVEPSDFAKLLAVISRRASTCRAIIMSGTLAPGGPENWYAQVTQVAREAKVLSVVDAKGMPLIEALKAGPGLVKPNRAELALTVGGELKDEVAVKGAMQELCERGAQRVIVTAGKAPTLATDGRSYWRISVPRITPVNPIGSGDAFTAGAIWRLVRGDDLGEACRWGSAAGAANALTPMPGELHRGDVERLAREVEIEII